MSTITAVRWVRHASMVLLGFAAMAGKPAVAQVTAGQGSWGAVLEWEFWIAVRDPADTNNNKILFPTLWNDDKLPGLGNLEPEISHAALIPSGTYAGWVLLWRKELVHNPIPPPATPLLCTKNNSVLWAINPAAPATPVAINYAFLSDVFCAGQSWDKFGQLLIGGGVPAVCGENPSSFPPEAYRFRPSALGIPQFPIAQPPAWPGPPYFELQDTPVRQEGNMAIGRYYPLVLPLFGMVSYFPNAVAIGPGVNMVVGGPPQVDNPPRGNEVWEVIEADKTSTTPVDWETAMIPEDPLGTDPLWANYVNPNPNWGLNSPSHAENPFSVFETYSRPGPLANRFPDRLFDSYPRMYQMPGGHILVWGDVDTGNPGANPPGMTWAIKPDYDPVIGQVELDGWESWRGDPGSGHTGAGVWHDSFYDSGVLLQELTPMGRVARVLMFGGSRNTGGTTWQVHDEIWQFNMNSTLGQDPVVEGIWTPKFEGTPVNWDYAVFQRVFGNVVVLPTGDLFVVGGTSVDDKAGQAGHEQGATAPVPPIIYDPDDPNPIFAANDGAFYEQPNVVAGTQIPVLPRLYHSVAVLLADGRVLVAGGQRTYDANGVLDPNPAPPSEGGVSGQLGPEDPRYTGQIFSPPYLDLESTGFGSRPIIEDAPRGVFLGDDFPVEVIRRCDREIDCVVLIRPAALTHHFDQDQRYVELAFSAFNSGCVGTDNVQETLTVTAPDVDEIPPGQYMLFVIESDPMNVEVMGHRVPSVAEFVRLKEPTP